jgi:hypothetical protein
MEQVTKKKAENKFVLGAVFLVPILLIATCNYYLNTHQEDAILTAPVVGDYFVFDGILKSGAQPFKVKSLNPDTVELLVPQSEFLRFESPKSESVVYDLEKTNQLYDTNFVHKMPRMIFDSLSRNLRTDIHFPRYSSNITLKSVFGKTRDNAVSTAVEKVGKNLP